MINKEEIRKTSIDISTKKQVLKKETKILIDKIVLSQAENSNKRNNKKWLLKKDSFKIDEISYSLDEQIQIEKKQLDLAKKNLLSKFNETAIDNQSKINHLVFIWNERIIDISLLNTNEKNIYKLRPSPSHFFYLIYNKINLIVKKIVREKINFYLFLKALSKEAKIWVLSKIPSIRLPYNLKTEKLLILLNGIESNNPAKNMFLLKKPSYRYITDFPELLESVFERKINFHIFRLIKLIKFSSDPNTLITNTEKNILEVKNGYKIYSSTSNNVSVLKKINLKIEEGEFVLLLGPSGSGKTTLMNCLSGIDQLSFGDIVVNNSNITKLTDHSLTKFRLNNIAYVFQHYGLLPNLNVEENIMVGDFLRTKNYTWKDKMSKNYYDKKFIENLLKDFEIYKERHKMTYELSGGQQQRVSIARAIAKKSKLIFADEPTSALDKKTSASIIKFLQKAAVKHNQTIIMITHDEKNIDYANRIIRLKDGYIIEDYRKESQNESKAF